MEGEKKKRKTEDNEDEKMENFFALIRSSREVRERMGVAAASENRGKAAGDNRPPPTPAAPPPPWNPTFRLEDFLEPAVEKAGEGPSSREGDKQEIIAIDNRDKACGDGKGLDLNLSL